MKIRKYCTKIFTLLFICVTILSTIQLSALAEGFSTAGSTRGPISSTQTSYLNNGRSGYYLKNNNGSLTADNGLLSEHGNSIKWTITPLNDGSGYYTISTVTFPKYYLSSTSYSATLTQDNGTIPLSFKWNISVASASGGGCLIRSADTGRYLYESAGFVNTVSPLPTVGTSEYKCLVWRIAESTSYYGNNSSYQYVQLPSNFKMKTLYMFANESRSPKLANQYSNAMWSSADNFTFTGYNSNYVTLNELTGTFTSTSSTAYRQCTVTATHKITGYQTTFSIVINPKAALVGVTNSGGHDHISCYSSVSSILRNNGYSQASIYSGAFTTSDIDNYLSNDAYNIFVSRSHGGVSSSGSYTYIKLDDRETSSVYYRSNQTITTKDLTNLRLALFVGCKTGYGGVGGNNLPSVAVEQGAETAVGFTETIYCATASAWTEDFFDYWDSGDTVEMICSYLARNTNYKAENLDKYIICGDKYMYID